MAEVAEVAEVARASWRAASASGPTLDRLKPVHVVYLGSPM